MNFFNLNPDLFDTATLSQAMDTFGTNWGITTDSSFHGNVIFSTQQDRDAHAAILLPGGLVTSLGGGFRCKTTNPIPISSIGSDGGLFFFGFLKGNQGQCGLLFNGRHGVSLVRHAVQFDGGAGVLLTQILGTTADNIITTGAANHFGYEITSSTTVGTFKLWVNGVLQLNLTGLNNADSGVAGITAVALTGGSYAFASGTHYYRDFYFNDFTGSVNLGYIGPAVLRPAYVLGVGHQNDFTAVGTSLTSQAVSEHPNNGDSTYAVSTTINDTSLFTITPPAGVTNIAAVQVDIIASNAGGSTANFEAVISDGTTDLLGISNPATSSYTDVPTSFNTNPTGGAWTASDLTTLQIGVKHVT